MIEQAQATADLRVLARQHESDRDGGLALVEDIGRRMRGPGGDEVRRALLTLASTDDDRLWGAAVEALTRGGPDAASALEIYLRTLQGSIQWRDELSYALARMQHRDALELILDHLQTHLADPRSRAAQTLFYLGLFDERAFLTRAVPYLSDALTEGDAQGLVNSLLAILGARPNLIGTLVREVDAMSPSVAHKFRGLIEHRLSQPYPVGQEGDKERLREALART